jgi:PAS domain S-box-containing protein
MDNEDQFQPATGLLFEQAVAQSRMAMCLSDPHKPDQPIIFANRAFRDLTGYDKDEIVGRNCRFLQGKDTDPETIAYISRALLREEVVVVEILNYRKDGTEFWNALHLGPIYDNDGKLLYYFGSQWDVSDVRSSRANERHAKMLARELSHRIKNLFSVISAIVSVTGRTRGVREETREIAQRIQALSRAFEPTLDDPSRGMIDIGQVVRAVLAPFSFDDERIQLDGKRVVIDTNLVSTLGLTLHELATNASKHGALRTGPGAINVTWDTRVNSEGIHEAVLVWEEFVPHPIDPPAIGVGSGLAVIDALLDAMAGRLDRTWKERGLHAQIIIPLNEPHSETIQS